MAALDVERQEIKHHDRRRLAFPQGLQHQRAVDVSPPGRARAVDRQLECAAAFAIQQPREHAGAVEPRRTQPLDRTSRTDQRRSLAIRQEPVGVDRWVAVSAVRGAHRRSHDFESRRMHSRAAGHHRDCDAEAQGARVCR
jgi:hypothetical protein